MSSAPDHATATQSAIGDRQSAIDSLLSRPLDQRLREYRYRFGQAVVFGLPVLALQWFGQRVGGPEAGRWVAVLQALLCGWVMYVAGTGMLFEGAIVWMARRRMSGDFIVAALATATYLFSAIAAVGALVVGRVLYGPLLFHVVIIMLIAWTGAQWLRMHRRTCQFDTRV